AHVEWGRKVPRRPDHVRRFVKHTLFYREVKIDGLSIFYRQAGPKDMPTLLLLHGLPSSSRMFGPLFTRLRDDYHLVAPDYPGFGQRLAQSEDVRIHIRSHRRSN